MIHLSPHFDIKKRTIIQTSITVFAIISALVHIFSPSIKIDSITLSLIILAVIPWLASLFKSLEFPGGLKLEYQDELDKVSEEVKAAGLVEDESKQELKDYDFLDYAESNPQLALAGLRMEIEKALKGLAISHGIENSRHSLSLLMNKLFNKGLISQKERSALADMMVTLNRAVHGEEVDSRATAWIIDIGPKVLHSLNKKIHDL